AVRNADILSPCANSLMQRRIPSETKKITRNATTSITAAAVVLVPKASPTITTTTLPQRKTRLALPLFTNPERGGDQGRIFAFYVFKPGLRLSNQSRQRQVRLGSLRGSS